MKKDGTKIEKRCTPRRRVSARKKDKGSEKARISDEEYEYIVSEVQTKG